MWQRKTEKYNISEDISDILSELKIKFEIKYNEINKYVIDTWPINKVQEKLLREMLFHEVDK